MRRRATSVCLAVLVFLVVGAVLGTAATTSTLFGTRFELGGTIRFKVEDSTTWWWGCCCGCPDTLILAWRIVDGAGLPVYSVVHDAPVGASAWVGSWMQIDADGNAVLPGSYMLYVDTSGGTLSRCFTLYDACSCCRPCSYCCCEDVTTITSCACRTTLVFIEPCTTGCFPLLWWFGCCSPCTSCP